MLQKLKFLMVAMLVVGFASTAMAQDEGTDEAAAGDGDKPISVGLLLGYGVSLEDGPNLWGLGFGLQGGYNIGAIFIGGRFIYYLGEDPVNIWELGAEVGYDLAAGPLTLRPGVGLGIANVTVDIPTVAGFGGGTASDSEIYVAPGAMAIYDLDDSMYLGGEARFQLILADETAKALIIMATGGMRF